MKYAFGSTNGTLWILIDTMRLLYGTLWVVIDTARLYHLRTKVTSINNIADFNMDQSVELNISFYFECSVCNGRYHDFSNSYENKESNLEIM